MALNYGSQIIDIDAFDTSMDVDAVGNRGHRYGKASPTAGAYSQQGSGHGHAHGHGHHGHGHDHTGKLSGQGCSVFWS